MRLLHPPQLSSNIILAHKYRYTATAAANAILINGASLLLSAGVVGTVTNTTVVSLFQALRVKRVEIWGMSSALAVPATVTLEWLGGAIASAPVEVSDTSLSTAAPAHINTRPPHNSTPSLWQLPSGLNNSMFQITCPAGSIIDVELELILQDGATITSFPAATAALGQIYYLALDCSVPSHNFVPVAVNTTF